MTKNAPDPEKRHPRAPDPKHLESQIGPAYDDLRDIAERFLSRERRDHTLQPTALVHETYLRMAHQRSSNDSSPDRLLTAAASVMRRVLVDHARKHRAEKRGGSTTRTAFDETLALYEERALDLIALDEALGRLESIDPESLRIVELRFFGGLSESEISRVLSISTRTVRRGWRSARNWLSQELDGPK